MNFEIKAIRPSINDECTWEFRLNPDELGYKGNLDSMTLLELKVLVAHLDHVTHTVRHAISDRMLDFRPLGSGNAIIGSKE